MSLKDGATRGGREFRFLASMDLAISFAKLFIVTLCYQLQAKCDVINLKVLYQKTGFIKGCKIISTAELVSILLQENRDGRIFLDKKFGLIHNLLADNKDDFHSKFSHNLTMAFNQLILLEGWPIIIPRNSKTATSSNSSMAFGIGIGSVRVVVPQFIDDEKLLTQLCFHWQQEIIQNFNKSYARAAYKQMGDHSGIHNLADEQGTLGITMLLKLLESKP